MNFKDKLSLSAVGALFPLFLLSIPLIFLIFGYYFDKNENLLFFKQEHEGSFLLEKYLSIDYDENKVNFSQKVLESLQEAQTYLEKPSSLINKEYLAEITYLQEKVNSNNTEDLKSEKEKCIELSQISHSYKSWILNYSNLILDPDLATYHLMDLHFMMLPDLIEILQDMQCQKSQLQNIDLNQLGKLQNLISRTILKLETFVSLIVEQAKKSPFEQNVFEPSYFGALSDLRVSLEKIYKELELHQNQRRQIGKQNLSEENLPQDEKSISILKRNLQKVQTQGIKLFNKLNSNRIVFNEKQMFRTIFSSIAVWIFSILLLVLFIKRNEKLKSRFKNQITAQQEALNRSTKLAAAGELTTCLGHEIGNYVHMIAICARNIENGVRGTHPDMVLYTQRLNKMSERISSIIKSVRNLSYNSKLSLKLQPVNLSEVIDEVLFVMENKIKKNRVEIQYARDVEGLLVLAVESELCQILINLVSNALDVLGEHKDRKIKIYSKKSDSQIHIYIEDSGPGISSEVANQIFDSFFTTKEIGKGSGLGLSISKQLVQNLGGDLKLVPSTFLSGACFEVTLSLNT